MIYILTLDDLPMHFGFNMSVKHAGEMELKGI